MAEITNLKDTVQKMESENHRDRFIAEYWQTEIRYRKLRNFCDKIEAAEIADTPKPTHKCPLSLLREQQRKMGEYLHILELRAIIEDVELGVGIVSNVTEFTKEDK